MTDARRRLEQARELLQQGQVLSALRATEEAALAAPDNAETYRLRARCLAGIERFADAKVAIDEGLRLDPESAEARTILSHITEKLQAVHREAQAPRRWQTSISKEMFESIETASHRYTYRGRAMIKNPFDMTLYMLLLWNLKPATIFEIGSYNGASALWMSDVLATYGVQTHIHSLDIVKVSTIEHPRITFHEGSGRALGDVFPADMIASSSRPLLIIDDADHTYETSSAVLRHFHPHARTGDYIVIEDALSAPGPRDALKEFLPAHSGEWVVDSGYCDLFGYNATWCINGFLRRI